MSSRLRPLVSGMQAPRTATVNKERPPKRKYAPKADVSNKIGVSMATSQFVNLILLVSSRCVLGLAGGWPTEEDLRNQDPERHSSPQLSRVWVGSR